MDGVERPVPRTPSGSSGAALRRPDSGRPGLAAERVAGPVRARRSAVGVGQLRHRARRLHAARPGVLRPQAQRGQRRGQPGRHGRQPLVELRRRGRDRRPGDPRRVRGRPATSRPPCCCPPAPRCCTMGDELGAPRAATTTPTARTTRSSWLDWDLAAGQQALLVWTRALVALRPQHPALRQNQFFERARRSSRPAARPGVAAADGTPMPDEPGTTATPGSCCWHCPATSVNGTGAGRPCRTMPFLMVLNAEDIDITVTLPESTSGLALRPCPRHPRPTCRPPSRPASAPAPRRSPPPAASSSSGSSSTAVAAGRGGRAG